MKYNMKMDEELPGEANKKRRDAKKNVKEMNKTK